MVGVTIVVVVEFVDEDVTAAVTVIEVVYMVSISLLRKDCELLA